MSGRAGAVKRTGGLLALVALAAVASAATNRPASSVPVLPAPNWPGDDTFVNFSFDQVSIPAFARLVGELTGRKFVVADNVQGKLTVISPRIRREEAYDLFVSILESAGSSVVQDGDVYRVVALPDQPGNLGSVVGVAGAVPAAGVVTKVFRLKHVRASDVRKLIEPKVRGGRNGAVGVIEDTNHLVVTDTAETVRRVEAILGELDQPGLARTTAVVTLQFASADDVARQLNESMGAGLSDTRGEQLRRRLPAPAESTQENTVQAVVVASSQANSLLLVGTTAQIEELQRIIRQMDVDTPAGRGRLNAIFLKYLQAQEAATNLQALLARTESGPQGTKVRRDIAIEPSPENNALLVSSSPGDFEVVKKLIEQLDREPEQVSIEVLIVEVTDGTGLDLGVDMAAVDLPGKEGDYTLQGSSTLDDDPSALLSSVQKGLFPGGLSVGVAHGTRVDAAGNVVVGYPGVINIRAVKEDSRFKVRANPSLMAQNNRPANVNIVNQIPILTSTISGGTGDSRDVIQNIERVDVGIKLKLTPHVIPGGQVRMDLSPSIEAVKDPGPPGTQYTPTIAKREVSTTVTVRDGEVIVIAGLTREDQTKVERRVPFLGSIPLLGWLFRSTADATEKTNMLIFVTPTIVTSGARAAEVTERATQATGLNYHEKQP